MPGDRSAHAAARLTAFVVAGSVTTAQEVVSAILREMPDADPSLVAEETLALIAVASARAVEAGSNDEVASAVSETVADLPFSYHDYLLGSLMLGNAEASGADRSVYNRLSRKREFYAVHLAPGQLPSTRVLKDKMELWMGRISPPGLPEHPAARLESMGLLKALVTHVRLTFEYARQEGSS